MTGAEVIGTYGEELKAMAERLQAIAIESKTSIHLSSTYVELYGRATAGADVSLFPKEEEKSEVKHDIFKIF